MPQSGRNGWVTLVGGLVVVAVLLFIGFVIAACTVTIIHGNDNQVKQAPDIDATATVPERKEKR